MTAVLNPAPSWRRSHQSVPLSDEQRRLLEQLLALGAQTHHPRARILLSDARACLLSGNGAAAAALARAAQALLDGPATPSHTPRTGETP